MAYLKAALLALAAALAIGAGAGLGEGIRLLPPQDRATLLAASISCALNGTAFYALVLVPAALVAVAIVRRVRRRR